MSSLDISLREELMTLRKKVVALETAESDNERYRKEITKLKTSTEEEKAKYELEFMNQLSGVIGENKKKIEEISSQLEESENANRALKEVLNLSDQSPEEEDNRFRDLELLYEIQMSQMTNKSKRQLKVIERLKSQLLDLGKSRDTLVKKLEESTDTVDDATLSKNGFPNPASKNEFWNPTVSQTKTIKEMVILKDENQSLKKTVALLEKENNEYKVALGKDKSKNFEGSQNSTDMEKESRDLKDSSRNESNTQQTREFGKSTSRSNIYSQEQQKSSENAGVSKNRTSQIIEQLERNLKNDAEKDRSSVFDKSEKTNGKKTDFYLHSLNSEVKSIDVTAKSENDNLQGVEKTSENSIECYKSQISKLEAELLSTKEMLASEKDASRKDKRELNLKLESINNALRNSENSRHVLAREKERQIKETSRMTKKKIKAEQKAKQQHQQLKQLQQVVEKNLNKVENTHTTDEIQIESLRDQVKSLEYELTRSQQQVSKLSKRFDGTNGSETSDSKLSELERKYSELERKYKKKINGLQNALESLQLKLGENVKSRDEEIERLRRLSEEKDNVTERLEKEKEQIVLNMQDMMKNRRGEIDDLHNDLLEMNTRLAHDNRQTSTLKAMLDNMDCKERENIRLRQRVTELSRELALKKFIDHD